MNATDITADAIAIQERDSFRSAGWIKALAPAKANLYLAVGSLRNNGYHEVSTVLHALNLHDTLYMRPKRPDDPSFGSGFPSVDMVATSDVELPAVAPEDNLAAKAVLALCQEAGQPEAADIQIRLEKRIPAQAGLGGASSDAAAALLAASKLLGLANDDPLPETVAKTLGADVAFFLHGGCAVFQGAGEEFDRTLVPMKSPVALIMPTGGVATPQAYQRFDEDPQPVPPALAGQAAAAHEATQVPLFNSLSDAAEALLPELATVKQWLDPLPQVSQSLLCGSGGCTFALCNSFADACTVVAEAAKRGWWSRASTFGSIRACVMDAEASL